MAENFPKVGSEMSIHIHEVQKTPKWLNLEKATQRYTAIN